MADTETIDRLFLELSQFTTARTRRELELEKQRDALYACCCAAIPCENATFETYDEEIGKMFQHTLQKELARKPLDN